jgi:DNA invertase Pin-like site-specific DNA recombinase
VVASDKCYAARHSLAERVSSIAQRDQLDAALDFVREGDTFVVTKMDRLARSTQHLLEIVQGLEEKGVALRILDFKGDRVDTHSPQCKLILTMFAAFAQFERELMLERQRAGIAKAKAEGRYKGRAPTARAKAKDVKALAASGIGPQRSPDAWRLAEAQCTAFCTDSATPRKFHSRALRLVCAGRREDAHEVIPQKDFRLLASRRPSFGSLP